MAKKSAQVPATLIIAIAAALTAAGCGCGEDVTQVRNCVDSNGYLLPDSYCGGSYAPNYMFGAYHSHIIVGHPIFVYGGSISGPRAYGYATRPLDGAEVYTRSGSSVGRYSGGSFTRSGSFGGTSRGGFGGFGGGGSFGS